MDYQLLQGDNRAVLDAMPAKSIHAIICSPPYFGLRSYSGDQQVEWPTVEYAPMPGLPMLRIQGCEPGCKHEWADGPIKKYTGGTAKVGLNGGPDYQNSTQYQGAQGAYCQLCGGWRGGLGNEPTLEAYIGHLILCLRSWHRVLRDDGCCFVNLGDSFAGSGGAGGDYNAGGIREGQPKFKPNKPKNGLKAKDLQMVPARFALAAQADGWYVRSRIIWAKGVSFLPDYAGSCMPECLDPATKVFVKSKSSGEIRQVTLDDILDEDESYPLIMTPSGWREIKHAWEVHKTEGVIFDAAKVDTVFCSREHLWPVSHDRRRVAIHEKRAEDLRDDGYNDYLLHCSIDQWLEPTIFEIDKQKLDYDFGWLIGLYAAEGGFGEVRGHRCKFTMAAHETTVLDRAQSIIESRFPVTVSRQHFSGYQHLRFSSADWHKIASSVVTGKVSTKSINLDIVLNTPQEFRQGLWDGYIDGDGSDRSNGVTATSASIDLRDCISVVASSIGIITSKRTNNQYDARTGKTYCAYQIWTPYIEKRKVKLGSSSRQITIRNKRFVTGDFRMIDIEVDGGLFLVNDGLVTHNSVQDRPTKSDEDIYLLTKQPNYFWDNEAVKEKALQPIGKQVLTGQIKSGQLQSLAASTLGTNQGASSRSLRSVWVINPQGYDGAHFAVWPEKLVAPMVKASTSEHGCCAQCGAPYERVVEKNNPRQSTEYREKLTTPKDAAANGMAGRGTKTSGLAKPGWREFPPETVSRIDWQATCACNADVIPCTVCDPFNGSGTTGAVACAHNRNYIGIDLSADYIELAHVRIREAINESGRAYIAPVCKVADFVDLPLFGG